jgi:DNA-binding winged helix-turn-helix (wHTH) protein
LQVFPGELALQSNGTRCELQPRVMQVLVALADARPAVVSREKLIARCWDGRIVGDDALNRCILALRHAAEHFTPRPFEIETVPRVGHRLVENGVAKKAAPPRARLKPWPVAAVAALCCLIVALGLIFLNRMA